MKKFFLKSSLIILPFLSCYAFYILSFNKDSNELSRVGNMKINYNFHKQYPELKLDTIHFESLQNSIRKKYKVLNIGDSYSRQEINNINGYINYLGKEIRLLNMYPRDPIRRIKEIISSNILDTLEIEYIILQSVERAILKRLTDNKKICNTDLREIKELDNKNYTVFNTNQLDSKRPKGFFSKATIFFTLNYIFNKDLQNKVLKVTTKKSLFSYEKNELLFYKADINSLSLNNNISLIKKANNELNKIAEELRKRNIKLIVLIPPDKYDFYFEEILNPKYEKPIFLNALDDLSKDYLYFNSKILLKKHQNKDIYFFDDSHWSPLASSIIAKEINKIISEE
tara:strand:- start:764 stop:1786 length:1023 start_codon:yes stop_codon:yes gene_type:complete